MRLTQPQSRPAAVRVDKFDAGGFEGTPYHVQRRSAGGISACLELTDRDNTNGRLIGQVSLTPIEETARSPALLWRDHSP